MNDLNLIGQRIKGLYNCSGEDDWVLLKTDKATFELRLGGINATSEERPQVFMMEIPVNDKTITKVMTDDFALYIELENGECIIHSNSGIDGNGAIDFEVVLVNKSDFDLEREHWYDADTELKEIT